MGLRGVSGSAPGRRRDLGWRLATNLATIFSRSDHRLPQSAGANSSGDPRQPPQKR